MDPITIIILVVIVLLIILLYKFAEWKDNIEGVGSPPQKNDDQNFAPRQPQTPVEAPKYIDIKYQIRTNYQKMLQSNTDQVMRMKDADYASIKNHVFSVLKTQIEKPDEYLINLYFHFQALQDVVYKWRNDREDAVELCREICYKIYEIVQCEDFLKQPGITGICSPSLTRLCVIEEKIGNYEKVLEICDICAICGIRDSSSMDFFKKRRSRIIKKIDVSRLPVVQEIPEHIKSLLYISVAYEDSEPEPSTIFADLQISDNDDGSLMIGYPDYRDLSPYQRDRYIDALKNILDGNQDIGYVFLYYYGLERHLLEGKFEEALDMIIKLRDVYDNKSFQQYSAKAIVLTCLKKQKYDHLANFIESVDKPYEKGMDVDTYLFAKVVCNIGFDAMDVFTFRKSFDYTSSTYVKENKEQFILYLEQAIQDLCASNTIDTSELLEKIPECELIEICPYANMSLNKIVAQLPRLHAASPFYEMCRKSLMIAHERVKEYRKELRKTLNASNDA